jgi:hypothetical protein
MLLVGIFLSASLDGLQAQTASPLWGHPRNDPIIGIIAEVPSYGGMWVGPGGYLHGSLTNLGDSSKLLAILTKFVSEPSRSFLKHPGSDYGIVIEKARYSYAQLTEWERKIENAAPALTSIGVDEKMNRLDIGVETVAAIKQTHGIVARLGVSLDAFTIGQRTVVQDTSKEKH